MSGTFDSGGGWSGQQLGPIHRTGKKAVVTLTRKICKIVAKYGDGVISAAITTPQGKTAFTALEAACQAFVSLDNSGEI